MSKYALGKQETLSELCQKKDEQIVILWKLLDDISTAGDMYRPNQTPYVKYVMKKCELRGEVANSFDGQTIKIK